MTCAFMSDSFSTVRTMCRDNDRLCAMKPHLLYTVLKKISPSGGARTWDHEISRPGLNLLSYQAPLCVMEPHLQLKNSPPAGTEPGPLA